MRLGVAILALGWSVSVAGFAAEPYAPVVPGVALAFPRDFGSHPAFRTEWWYITGWLADAAGQPLGFQITFFRTRPESQDDNPSAFTAHQILIAHCALSDPRRGRLYQDQRVRRGGMGLVEAAEPTTDVRIEGWSLHREATHYRADVDADGFSLHLELAETQAMMLNGDAGYSRKGPDPLAASYYYSVPHLRVEGSVTRPSGQGKVTGEAWLDHEWSSEYLDPQAAGWEWTGLNLSDGGALMAFRIRGLDGQQRWAGGTIRDAGGHTRRLEPSQVAFDSHRQWKSPRTGIVFPVEWRVRAGDQDLDLVPLLDDQENDTRLSTGAIYWEGAVEARAAGHAVGRGYLELTGYGEKLNLP